MSFIVTVWTLSPWIIFKYCVSYVLASRKKSVRTPVYEKRFIVQMSLYFTNINRSTDQISLKFLFAAESQIILNISLPVQRTTQPSFKRACRIRGKAPYQAYLFAIDRCFKINLTTFLPQTFRSSKFSVHSLAFSLFRSRLARIRQHSFSPKKMSFFYHTRKTFTKMQNTWPVPLMMSDSEKYELTSMSWLLPIFAIFECFQSYSFCFTSPLMIDGVNYFKIPVEAFFVR